MATNNNRTIPKSIIKKIIKAVSAIIVAIISGVCLLINTYMQINADKDPSGSNHSPIYSSDPNFSPPDTSTPENPTNDSTPYPEETNDSNTVETLDEKGSSNNGFVDDLIHNNVTEEETIEEPTNDSSPNGDVGILTYESTDSDIISSGEIIGIRVP